MKGANQPRIIPHFSSGPNKRATDLNNALSILEEFVSARRLATLAAIPTPAELIAAVDLYLTCESDPELIAHAHALRRSAESWRLGAEIPSGVYAAARAIFRVLGPEPDRDWEADDGYRTCSEAAKTTPGMKRPEVPEATVEASQKAAHVAQNTMYVLNLAALLASPRILRKATMLPSRDHLLEHLDALIALFSSDTLISPAGSAAGMQHTARQLRDALAGWTPSHEAPLEVQQASRALLADFAVPEPPEGWDAFEGVSHE